MISVFFRCNCPFVGYLQRKVDYVNHRLTECTKQEMTYTGYSLFRSSGSYMILANFEGRRYFHSRQSKTSALDDQNRPVRNNVVFVGNAPEDDVVIGRLAGYALMKETEFYKEIAAMITLQDEGFEVDYEKLKAFIKRFEQPYMVNSTNPADMKMCREVFFRPTNNDVDMIVLEADQDFLNKQLGRVAKVQYAFDYKAMQELSKRVTITFPVEKEKDHVPSQDSAVVSMEDPELEEAPVRKEASQKPAEAPVQPEPAREEEKAEVTRETVPEVETLDDEPKSQYPASMAEELAVCKKSEYSNQPAEERIVIDKRSFIVGAILGAVGILLLMLILKLIF